MVILEEYFKVLDSMDIYVQTFDFNFSVYHHLDLQNLRLLKGVSE